MRLNKQFPSNLILAVSVTLALLVISACTRDTDAALESPTDAQQWLQTELQKGLNGSTPLEVNRLNEQLRNPDRRLVRTIDATTVIPQHLFVTVEGAKAEKAIVASVKPAQLTDQGTINPKPLSNPRNSLLLDAPNAIPPKNEMESEPNLEQVDMQQIQYVGLIQVSGERFGLVRVGSHVYRVTPNMRIGRGQWRILNVDAAQMQVLMNGKTVNYGK